jgi:hypothetical protein
MNTPMSHAHTAAWLLAAALTACSHEKKAAPPPAPKPTAAEESQKAFQLAAQQQKEAGEQQKRVEAARAAVVAAQQQLAHAQAQEQQERAKAQQLQEQAGQNLQEGVRQAQQAHADLAGATGGAEGMQTVNGTVAEATASEVVVQTPGGSTLTFHVDDRTQVLVGSERRSIAHIQRGADAQVAYDPKTGQQTALIIRVMPAGGAGTTPPQGAEAPAPR